MLPWLVRWSSWCHHLMSAGRAIIALALALWHLGLFAPALAGATPALLQDNPPAIAPCAQASPTGPIAAEAMAVVETGVPQGLTITPLAVSRASHLPTAPSTLQVSQLVLPPGAGADTRSAVGPILFYVEAGAITFFASGVAIPATAGDTILVEKDEYYTLENDGSQTATLLRLGVAPADAGDMRIAIFDSPQDAEPTRTTTLPESQLLVRAAIAPALTNAAWLILTCVTLPTPHLAITGVHHPGPTGLWVESGPLGIQPDRVLPTGGCTLFAPEAPHDLRSLDSSAAALLFAVIPDGGQLWTDATAASLASTPPDDLECGNLDANA